MQNADNAVQVIDRSFAILEYLSQAGEARGPTEIAAATGMAKSTVYRLLTAMCCNGYVEKAGPGVYVIGIKLVEIVSNHINSLELQTEARPFLSELHAELGLIIHLGILDRAEVVYVEKMDISRNLRLYAQIGLRVPAYCSSLGKCLLSCLAGDELEYLLSGIHLEKFTPNTITTLSALKAHLRLVRQQGWAIDEQEYIVGHRCIGAPIYDYRGEMIAAISASGPVTLLTDDRVSRVIERVKAAAAQISRRLCYQVT